MEKEFAEFQKKKDFLICVDSDGTILDTMEAKHHRCLCPVLIKCWELDAYAKEVTQIWDEINLYSNTRGIVRYKALALVLSRINDTLTSIEGLAELLAWVNSGTSLSWTALKVQEASLPEILKKTLSWSEEVNHRINNLSTALKPPIPGAAMGLEAASRFADIAVISTANHSALLEEWGAYGLLPYADVVLGQEAGSKAHCIAELLKKGYSSKCVMMIGDAPGDWEAAKNNGVSFLPILVNHEEESWQQITRIGFPALLEGTLPEYEAAALQRFHENLGGIHHGNTL